MISSSNNRLGCWENPPSPATGGRGEPSGWGGRGVWGSLLIYTVYIYIHMAIYIYTHAMLFCNFRSVCGGVTNKNKGFIWFNAEIEPSWTSNWHNTFEIDLGQWFRKTHIFTLQWQHYLKYKSLPIGSMYGIYANIGVYWWDPCYHI